ncbi:MAG: hypothetical protein M3490_01680 [Chloroflexota bacterium]|nr:hypothetical protein [Chloroflexota bacterium]
MQRLASAFLTLWVMFFVPSLIVWLLVVRLGSTGSDHYASVWHWCVDKLTFPLVLSPITDWAWRAVEAGSMISGAIGFVLLTAVWAAMFAFTLVFIAGWWMLLITLLSGKKTGAITSPSPEYGTSEHYSSPRSSLYSPAGALYLVTIPLALTWNGLKALVHPTRFAGVSTITQHPVVRLLWSLTACFVIVTFLYFTYLGVFFIKGSDTYWRESIRAMWMGEWHGYLDTFRIPRLLDTQFQTNVGRVLSNWGSMSSTEWHNYTTHWYREPELRAVMIIMAMRHAILAVVLLLIFKAIDKVVR